MIDPLTGITLPLNYSKVILAQGPFSNIKNPLLKREESSLMLSWSYQKNDLSIENDDDAVYFVVYDPIKKQNIMAMGKRADTSMQVNMPDYFRWNDAVYFVFTKSSLTDEVSTSSNLIITQIPPITTNTSHTPSTPSNPTHQTDPAPLAKANVKK